MNKIAVLRHYLENSIADQRIGPLHHSLYLSLLYHWEDRGQPQLLLLYPAAIMRMAHIRSARTYYRGLKQLHEFGYLIYRPCYDARAASAVILCS